jgi:DNA-binding CsgD family transcriptional regulator
MTPTIFYEADKIWKQVAKEANEEELKFELEIHKKLLNVFQVGDYYYYIFNVKHSAFDFVSSDVTRVLGYDVEKIDVPFLVGLIHPEDQPYFLNFENQVGEFFATLSADQIPNYKVRYDYRIRKSNGDYMRILQQVVTIQFSEDKGLLRTLGIHTDISSIKPDGAPVLSFIGLNGEPSYENVKAREIFSVSSAALTSRERQILGLLIEGKKSDEISELLYISKLTVDTHRKNLLKKTTCSNTAELISTAIKKGWV